MHDIASGDDDLGTIAVDDESAEIIDARCDRLERSVHVFDAHSAPDGGRT